MVFLRLARRGKNAEAFLNSLRTIFLILRATLPKHNK